MLKSLFIKQIDIQQESQFIHAHRLLNVLQQCTLSYTRIVIVETIKFLKYQVVSCSEKKENKTILLYLSDLIFFNNVNNCCNTYRILSDDIYDRVIQAVLKSKLTTF